MFIVYIQVSKTLEEFSIEEQPSSVLEEKYPNLKVVQSAVKLLQVKEHVCLSNILFLKYFPYKV